MTIPARYEQPCMAYCGHDIDIDDEIEEGSNGWQHYKCAGQQQRRHRTSVERAHQERYHPPQAPEPSAEELALLTDDERAIFDQIRAKRPHQQPDPPTRNNDES